MMNWEELGYEAQSRLLSAVFLPSKKDRLREAVASLPEKEAKVIYHRFQERMTFEEVAKLMGTTRKQVRQLEVKALNKLREKGV